MAARRIAVVPGDGIGREVTAAARAVLDAVAARHGLDLAYDESRCGVC
jgi:tartrate dehydrogenase/decarboxylase/D-malate dehydrogenase